MYVIARNAQRDAAISIKLGVCLASVCCLAQGHG